MTEDGKQWILDYYLELIDQGVNATYDVDTFTITIVNTFDRSGVRITETTKMRFYDSDDIPSLHQSSTSNDYMLDIIKPTGVSLASLLLDKFIKSIPSPALLIASLAYDTIEACSIASDALRNEKIAEACFEANNNNGLILIEKYYYFDDPRVVNLDTPGLSIETWSLQ